LFVLNNVKKKVIKCALAYFLGSLFTFVPAFTHYFGLYAGRSSHLVAAVAVFFNPAKTIGGIYEAVLFALLGGVYGVCVAVGSMACAVWFNVHELYLLGHIVSVVFWCGGSMFVVAFLKAKLNKPSFNSGK
jgi:hypothetical protein